MPATLAPNPPAPASPAPSAAPAAPADAAAPRTPAGNAAACAALIAELGELRAAMRVAEGQLHDWLARVRPEHRDSALNLVHFLVLRRHDLRAVQERLADLGLSSLGRSDSHVMANLDKVLGLLHLLADRPWPPPASAPLGFHGSARQLQRNANRLLGVPPEGRAVRIMVTLPAEAATDAALVERLVAGGMDIARINCAHDGAEAWHAMAVLVRRAALAQRRAVRIHMDLGGPKLRTGPLPARTEGIRLQRGDRLRLLPPGLDLAAWQARHRRTPAIGCTLAPALAALAEGERVWFDDGRIGAVVRRRCKRGVALEVTQAREGGELLRADKGINLPDTALQLPALTEADHAALPVVARHADSVGLSFAQGADDVRQLRAALAALGVPDLGLVLKVETQRGFAQLPQMLLAAMEGPVAGVMIARGDLAVECGYERLAEVQEEMLWACEAAHLPVIWATQVLETLAKTGRPTRAEITDAAMGERAECVMLNKGPHIVDAIHTLDLILRRMQQHQSKKRSLLRALKAWELGTPAAAA